MGIIRVSLIGGDDISGGFSASSSVDTAEGLRRASTEDADPRGRLREGSGIRGEYETSELVPDVTRALGFGLEPLRGAMFDLDRVVTGSL